MSAIINGDSPSITFSDGTTQATSAIVSGKVPYTNLPAGSVLQVVNATYSTETTNNTDTYADTGLAATITPKFSTSKILVLASNNFSKFSNANAGVTANICRNSTQIVEFAKLVAYTGTTITNTAGASVSYLDSPATTSATTYKMQFKCSTNASGCHAQETSSVATMTLLEIAQ